MTRISDLAPKSAPDPTDLLEVENAGGVSESIPASSLNLPPLLEFTPTLFGPTGTVAEAPARYFQDRNRMVFYVGRVTLDVAELVTEPWNINVPIGVDPVISGGFRGYLGSGIIYSANLGGEFAGLTRANVNFDMAATTPRISGFKFDGTVTVETVAWSFWYMGV